MLTPILCGPQVATNVVATAMLPVGASYVSGDSSCIASGSNVICSTGSLLNGGSVSFNFQVLWISLGNASSINATATSDLPDTITTNNSSNIQITLGANNCNTDVPLPPWTITLIGLNLKKRLY